MPAVVCGRGTHPAAWVLIRQILTHAVRAGAKQVDRVRAPRILGHRLCTPVICAYAWGAYVCFSVVGVCVLIVGDLRPRWECVPVREDPQQIGRTDQVRGHRDGSTSQMPQGAVC